MDLWTLLIIILVLALIGGAFPFGGGPVVGAPAQPGWRYYGYGFGWGGGGLLGLILLVLVIMLLLGRL